MIYHFDKQANLEILAQKIRDSAITTALDSVSLTGSFLEVSMKADLSPAEEMLLGQIVSDHVYSAPTPSAMEVITQSEKNDLSLKLASAKGSVDAQTGFAQVLIRCPGTPGTGDGRHIAGGMAWFSTPHSNDRVQVHITDEDNLMGLGAGVVVGSYTDDDAPEESRGWFIPAARGFIDVQAIGGYGVVPSGLYLRITGQRSELTLGGDLFVNLQWGKKEVGA